MTPLEQKAGEIKATYKESLTVQEMHEYVVALEKERAHWQSAYKDACDGGDVLLRRLEEEKVKYEVVKVHLSSQVQQDRAKIIAYEAGLEKAREALKFYAKPAFCSACMLPVERGEFASEALSSIEKLVGK